MMWQLASLFGFVVTLTLGSVLPARDSQDSVSTSFSLDVRRREAGKRDFVREWAAARQKWGVNLPQSNGFPFSLADPGTVYQIANGKHITHANGT